MVREYVVEHLRHCHRSQEQSPPIKSAPSPVGALDPVGDDHMGVQVRVTVAGVPMVEPRCEHPAGTDLHGPLGADTREQGPVLNQPEDVDDRGVMRAGHRGPGLLAAQTPQDAGRLRDRERQVEPGHHPRRIRLRPQAQRDPGHRVPRGPEQVRQLLLGHHIADPDRGGGVGRQPDQACPQPQPLRVPGSGVVVDQAITGDPRRVAAEVRQLLLRNHIADPDRGGGVGRQPDQARPQPSPLRVPGSGVVVDQAITGDPRRVTARGMTQQVLVTSTTGQPMQRHHWQTADGSTTWGSLTPNE